LVIGWLPGQADKSTALLIKQTKPEEDIGAFGRNLIAAYIKAKQGGKSSKKSDYACPK
jgi:hypothetical protein